MLLFFPWVQMNVSSHSKTHLKFLNFTLVWMKATQKNKPSPIPEFLMAFMKTSVLLDLVMGSPGRFKGLHEPLD